MSNSAHIAKRHKMIFHNSYNENLISELEKQDGMFGKAMFFSYSKENSSSGCFCYSMDESNLVIGTLYNIFSEEEFLIHAKNAIKEVMEMIECSEEEAEEMLESEESVVKSSGDFEEDAENQWNLQKIQAELAFKCGFGALELEDENGIVLAVNSELITLKKA